LIVVSGILVVDKPVGWTSHDVVNKTRNLLGGIKVGHTGTLDPFATGVLVLMLGTATKSASSFSGDRKSYDADVTFGHATDTYDVTGETTETGDPGLIDPARIEAALDHFRGEIQQVPPMYSAKKVRGRKLYELARKGKTIEREPRLVTVSRLDYDLSAFPAILKLSMDCSAGTYVRSIAHDLGQATGCPAHLSALRRTAAGRFTIDQALDFSVVAENNDRDRLSACIQPLPVEQDTEK
jgi:tRNA pseudouridine55 synthase